MKYLLLSMPVVLLIIFATILNSSFDLPKCDHVFTELAADSVEVKFPTMQIGIYQPPPSGFQEGPEIICVKCFHRQRQVIEYPRDYNLRWYPRVDTSVSFNKTFPVLHLRRSGYNIDSMPATIAPSGGSSYGLGISRTEPDTVIGNSFWKNPRSITIIKQ